MKHSVTCALCSKDAGKISGADIPNDRKVVFVCTSCRSSAGKIDIKNNPPDQQILSAIRSYGESGISYSDMLVKPPFEIFAQWKMLDYFLEILVLQQKIYAAHYLGSNPHYFSKELLS